MRVFIAVTLSKEIKMVLEEAQVPFRLHRLRGNFTAFDNFHLTLVFIGEVTSSQVDDLEDLIEEISAEPFEVKLGELGCFNQKDGEIWWVGIQKEPKLMALQAKIVAALKEASFDFNEKHFTAHLTLCRNYRSAPSESPLGLPVIPKAIIPIKRISLMRSERIHDILTYSELYGKDLTP